MIDEFSHDDNIADTDLRYIQDNPFVVFFLIFNEYANLFPKVVNRFIEFLVNTIGDTTDQCKP